MRRTSGLVLVACLACGLRTPEQRERDWAQSMTPKPLVATGAPTLPVKHTVRVRAVVDSQYVAQNPQWKTRVEALVARASALAEARFATRFELVAVGTWEHPELRTLPPLLDHLRAEHPEGDADLVVGFTSSLQLFTATFEELGLATLFGHHAVMRGIDQHEQSDIIVNDLKRLSVEEKVAVVRARVEHQEAVVFLHEWGHSAGAIHDRDVSFIMSPLYRDSHRDFSPASSTSIELALRHLRGDRIAWLAAARAHLTALPPSALARGEDEHLTELFGSADAGTAAAPAQEEDRPLADADRQLFNIAVGKEREGRAADALGTMSALVKRYPRHAQVQIFACHLALQAKEANASALCATALAVAPNDPRPALALAWARADADDFSGAREAALEAKRRAAAGKRDPHTQAELGQALVRVGYLAFAEEEARLAETTLPAQQVLEAAARQRRTVGLTEGALPGADEAAYVEAWQLAVKALHGRKPAEARQRSAALAKQYPKLAGAWSLACEAQLALGFSADARASCGRALQLDAGLGRAHYLLAVIDENERRRASAIEHLEKAISGDEANEDAWRRLAGLYVAVRMDAARAALAQRYEAKFGRPLK